MKKGHDSLTQTHGDLFHRCWQCNKVGLKPGILNTKHGDYGMRQSFKDEKELKLNDSGICTDCETTIKENA